MKTIFMIHRIDFHGVLGYVKLKVLEYIIHQMLLQDNNLPALVKPRATRRDPMRSAAVHMSSDLPLCLTPRPRDFTLPEHMCTPRGGEADGLGMSRVGIFICASVKRYPPHPPNPKDRVMLKHVRKPL